MPRRRLPSVQFQPTEQLDAFRQQVQDELNKAISAINAPEFQSNMSMRLNRIEQLADGVKDKDAVNLSQLRKFAPLVFTGRRRGQVRAPKAPTFNAEIVHNGVFSLTTLGVPDGPFDLHAVTLSVDETTQRADRGTSTATVTANQTAIPITGLTGVVAGDYILLHDPTQNGATAVTNDEIMYVDSVSSGTYTVVRGRWGSADVAHASGRYAWPLEIRHHSMPGQANFFTGDTREDVPNQFDMLLPSRCVVAVKAFCANDAGSSPITTSFLPVYTAASTGNPLMPGLRTCTGWAKLLPLSVSALTVGTNKLPIHVKMQDTASIRTIYAYVDTAPSGADIEIDVKIDDGTGYVDLDTLTIANGDTESYASTNVPADRRMPYGINWADLLPLPQDAKLQFDINTVGSTTPGGLLMVVVQT